MVDLEPLRASRDLRLLVLDAVGDWKSDMKAFNAAMEAQQERSRVRSRSRAVNPFSNQSSSGIWGSCNLWARASAAVSGGFCARE
jgi:anti-sigma-K factor RskA